MRDVKKYLRSHWVYVLGIAALLGFMGNILVFYPGFLSNDSMNQLKQAMGLQPISDLLPPVMTLVWRGMIRLTGSPASMLVFQLLMLWSALFGLALYVFKKNQSHLVSLLILFIGVLPGIITISGVVWKDTQMTFAIFLSVVLILWLRITTKKAAKIVLLTTSLLFLVYACMMRYNAIPALMPLMFVAFMVSGFIKRIRYQLLATLGVVVSVVIGLVAITSVMHIKSGGMSVALIIDDIANLIEEKDIKNAAISDESSRVLSDVSVCAKEKNVLINNLWVCLKDDDRLDFVQNSSEDAKRAWTSVVSSNPLGYLLYRFEVYILFLFPYEGTSYVWQNGIVENDLGLAPRFDRLGDAVGLYVNNFGYRHFSFLFEPWFWMLASISVLLFLRRRALEHKVMAGVLAISSILYLLSYFPTGATPDYRYIYWPVVACITAAVLCGIDMSRLRGAARKTTLAVLSSRHKEDTNENNDSADNLD